MWATLAWQVHMDATTRPHHVPDMEAAFTYIIWLHRIHDMCVVFSGTRAAVVRRSDGVGRDEFCSISYVYLVYIPYLCKYNIMQHIERVVILSSESESFEFDEFFEHYIRDNLVAQST